jgi:hypothetical protein
MKPAITRGLLRMDDRIRTGDRLDHNRAVPNTFS